LRVDRKIKFTGKSPELASEALAEETKFLC